MSGTFKIKLHLSRNLNAWENVFVLNWFKSHSNETWAFIFFPNIPGANTKQHTSSSVVLTVHLITAFVFVSYSENRVNRVLCPLPLSMTWQRTRGILFRRTRKENIWSTILLVALAVKCFEEGGDSKQLKAITESTCRHVSNNYQKTNILQVMLKKWNKKNVFKRK